MTHPHSLTLVSSHLCPFVQRATIALLEKGASFERVYVDLAAKPDWFLAISPLGKIPLLKVLRADGTEAVLFESSVISEFVDETQPGPKLHPADSIERALHRAWMEFGSSILVDLWGLQTAKDGETFNAKVAAIREKAVRIDGELKGGPYFAGEAFSLVDAVFAPVFRIVSSVESIAGIEILDDLPRLSAWQAALAARPSVIAAVPDDYLTRLSALLHRQNGFLLARAA